MFCKSMLKKKFQDLIIAITRSNFEDAETSLDNFMKENPEVAFDKKLVQEIDLFRAMAYWRDNKRQKALGLYMSVWKQYTTNQPDYALTGLYIVKILVDMERFEDASRFVEDVFISVSDEILITFHPTILTSVLPAYLPGSTNYFKNIRYVIAHIEQGLEFSIQLDHLDPVQTLREIDFKVHQEGKELTRIMATSISQSVENTVQELETFLGSAQVKLFREQAINYLDSLRH